MKMNIKFGTALLSIAILTACGNAKAGEQQVDETSENSIKVVEVETGAKDETESVDIVDGTNQVTANQAETEKEPSTSTDQKSYDVTVYYPSTAYIVDGDEDNKFTTKSIQVKGDITTAIDETIQELKNVPKDAESVGLESLTILKTSFKDGVATVDFSSEKLTGGSMEEEVLVSSIVNSLLSIQGIKSVEFFVDGAPAETLMGQIDISKPISNNM